MACSSLILETIMYFTSLSQINKNKNQLFPCVHVRPVQGGVTKARTVGRAATMVKALTQ